VVVYLPGQELRFTPATGAKKTTRYYTHAGQTIAMRTAADDVIWLSGDHHDTVAGAGRMLHQVGPVPDRVVRVRVPVRGGPTQRAGRREYAAVTAGRGPGLLEALKVIGGEALVIAGRQIGDPGDVAHRVVRVPDVRDGVR
jgi:hypothetical protein